MRSELKKRIQEIEKLNKKLKYERTKTEKVKTQKQSKIDYLKAESMRIMLDCDNNADSTMECDHLPYSECDENYK